MATTVRPPAAAVAATRPARALPRAIGASRGGWLLPALLVAGCAAAAAAVGVAAAARGDATAADAELARLLRAMAAIKGVMLVAGVGALAWRLARPTPPGLAAAYLVGGWVAAGAVAAMWSLLALGAVAVVLHGTAAVVALLAWRDAEFFPAPGGVRGSGGARA